MTDKDEAPAPDDAMIARLRKRCHGCYDEPSPCAICEAADALAAQAREIAGLSLRVREQDEWIKAYGQRTERELEQAEAALAERDKDAERYRWLCDCSGNAYMVLAEYQLCGRLDAAIDAAIRASAKD